MLFFGGPPTRFRWFTKGAGEMLTFGWASRAFCLLHTTVEMLIFWWASHAFSLVYERMREDIDFWVV